ncbi:CDC42 small effector protein 2-like [Leucoraja erinacea]|uniref:CDC42 small effector protein 2-like n=1 Tax=Leucoraja erinaceus TaxID=7782 RepID=UPI002456F807|nr:CDC42 small effector protein 2-like [Leucoraja erinacea]XP_055514339.1 CDC42 small effector protein 2-like [Leucoraja erinacea]
MSEFWLCFNCCIAEQPQPKRRRRIDRTMIGEPTNFVHTSHMGAGDMFGEQIHSVNDVHDQMQSKGGYSDSVPISIRTMHLIDTTAA